MTAVWPGMRVVYAGQLHGEVLLVGPGAWQAKVRFDNGTTDWFRTDLMVPEGEHDPQEPTPGAWRDRAGFLWLETEPGSRQVFCYDAPVRRRMGDKWPVQPLEEAETEFGPMERMVPVPQGGEDRIVFLYSLGRSTEVPPGFNGLTTEGLDGGQFEELVPGYQVLLLSMGSMQVNGREHVNGAFVVIRRNRE
jgi:hypothetical protein